MKNKKTRKPDGIPVGVCKLVFPYRVDLLFFTFKVCLQEGVFPSRWKVTRLVLIIKWKGDPELPSTYWPLYVLHTAGKVVEKLVGSKLYETICAVRHLSPRQFGFRGDKSTIDATMQVLDAVHQAEERSSMGGAPHRA